MNKHSIPIQRKVVLFAAIAAAMPLLSLAAVLLIERYPFGLSLLWLAVLVSLLAASLIKIYRMVVTPAHSLANLLEALRLGDYSIRAHRPAAGSDVFHQAYSEINQLAKALRGRRLDQLEAAALLEKVLDEIDIGVLVFDAEEKLVKSNPAAARMLARPSVQLVDCAAQQLGLGDYLTPGQQFSVHGLFGDDSKRHIVSCQVLRQGGAQHRLLVISDLSSTLRAEERDAWRRLIRVMGHELNNSLTPIKSIAEVLLSQWPPDANDRSAEKHLRIIRDRAVSLGRFIRSYSRLARLPAPKLKRIDIAKLLGRVTSITSFEQCKIEGPEQSFVHADAGQLEQALINVLNNAKEANLATGGGVSVRWHVEAGMAVIDIRDEGEGIANQDNLFVPFFTTKPEGSGIGLLMARQILEAHGGRLTLRNRSDASGCLARIQIPL